MRLVSAIKTLVPVMILCVPIMAQENPCADSIFAKVKSAGFENLTDREFEYYKIKSSECEQYKNREIIDKQRLEQKQAELGRLRTQQAAAREQRKSWQRIGQLLSLAILYYLLFLSPYALFG